jgi:hypothetical protein
MQIAVHIGAHATDDNRLINCLRANRDLLWQRGVSIPAPAKYRNHLREALRLGERTEDFVFGRDGFFEIADIDPEDSRLVLSSQNVLGIADRIFHRNELYGLLEQRARTLTRLFPEDELEIFVGLRNPATFIPTAFELSGTDDIRLFLGETNIYQLRWSHFIKRLQAVMPDTRVTAWCNEDLPLIFGQVARAMAGVSISQPLTNIDSVLQDVLSEEGLRNYRSYIDAHPPKTDRQEHRIITAFADKFGLDTVEEEIDVTGWSTQLIDELTDIYDEDFEKLQRLPNLRFIAP